MAIDPNTGVYVFDGSEPDYPMVDTLNLLATSTRDAVAAVRTGDFLMTTLPVTQFLTLGSGWSYRSGFQQVVRRMGDRYEFSLNFTKSSDIVHGDAAATINAQFAQVSGSEWSLNAAVSGGSGAAITTGAFLNQSRQIAIVSPPSGRRFLGVSGFYTTT